MEIIPAIMPRSYFDLEEKINQVVSSAPIIQLDLMDGKYVNGKTWPFDNLYQDTWLDIMREVSGMPNWENVDYEIDLMIIFSSFADIVISRALVHSPAAPGIACPNIRESAVPDSVVVTPVCLICTTESLLSPFFLGTSLAVSRVPADAAEVRRTVKLT